MLNDSETFSYVGAEAINYRMQTIAKNKSARRSFRCEKNLILRSDQKDLENAMKIDTNDDSFD